MLHTFNFADFTADIDRGYLLLLFDVVVVIFYALVAWGALSGWRSRFTRMLFSFMLVDVLIHLVFRFGLDEGQIYSGHWMFLFPLLIAGVFRDKRLKKYYSLLSGMLIVLAICFFTNNIFRIVQFVLS